MAGAIPGMEALDIAWDAQARIENAILNKIALTMVSYDFNKFFDSFEHSFTREMLLHLGLPPTMVELTYNLYTNMNRVIKKGRALSSPFKAFNGFGQGDVMSLLPALLIVSWQFYLIDAMLPNIHEGAYIDDRNFQGPLAQIIQLDDIVAKFDLAAGLFTQHDKTEFILTDPIERQIL